MWNHSIRVFEYEDKMHVCGKVSDMAKSVVKVCKILLKKSVI